MWTTARTARALSLTLDLAEHFGARVSAIYVDPIPLSPQLFAMSTALSWSKVSSRNRSCGAEVESLVEDAATKREIAWEWRQAEGPLGSLAVQARTVDLLVTTEGDGDSGPMFKASPSMR